jgi:hypothetical protein
MVQVVVKRHQARLAAATATAAAAAVGRLAISQRAGQENQQVDHSHTQQISTGVRVTQVAQLVTEVTENWRISVLWWTSGAWLMAVGVSFREGFKQRSPAVPLSKVGPDGLECQGQCVANHSYACTANQQPAVSAFMKG